MFCKRLASVCHRRKSVEYEYSKEDEYSKEYEYDVGHGESRIAIYCYLLINSKPRKSAFFMCGWFMDEAVLDFPYPLNPAHLPALMLSSIQHRLKHLREPTKLWAKYTHFWILVISQANAGKTMVLKCVCNTTEDPCIYDKENHNLLSYFLRWLLCSYWPSTTSSNRLHKYQPSAYL